MKPLPRYHLYHCSTRYQNPSIAFQGHVLMQRILLKGQTYGGCCRLLREMSQDLMLTPWRYGRAVLSVFISKLPPLKRGQLPILRITCCAIVFVHAPIENLQILKRVGIHAACASSDRSHGKSWLREVYQWMSALLSDVHSAYETFPCSLQSFNLYRSVTLTFFSCLLSLAPGATHSRKKSLFHLQLELSL